METIYCLLFCFCSITAIIGCLNGVRADEKILRVNFRIY